MSGGLTPSRQLGVEGKKKKTTLQSFDFIISSAPVFFTYTCISHPSIMHYVQGD